MNSSRKFTYDHVILLSILLVAGVLRLWHVGWGLPDLYEEALPFRASYDFWNWDGKGISLDPSYFTYPAFTYYLNFISQGLVFILGYIFRVYSDFASFQQSNSNDVTTFVLIGRYLSVAFDLGTIVITYILGRRIFDANTGLLAALLIAFNSLHIRESNLINVDTPLTFFTVLGIYFIYQVYTDDDKRSYVWAGLSIGLASATKYNGGLLAVFLLIVQALKSGNLKGIIPSLRKVNLWYSYLISVGIFIIFNPYIVLHFRDFVSEFEGVFRHMKYGHLGVDPTVNSGWYYLINTLPENLGWGMLAVVVLSLIYAGVERKKDMLVLLIYPVLYFGTFASMSMRAERYLLPIIPILILSGAYLLMSLYDLLSKIKLFSSSNLAKWGIGFAVLVLLLYVPARDLEAYDRKFHEPDTRAVAKQIILEHLQKDGVVATGPYGINLPDGTHVLNIPFDAMNTERLAAFYDTRWYRDLDILVVSSYDYDRYRKEQERFRDYLLFYDSLKTQYVLIDSVVSTENNNGPSFWIYRPPTDTLDTPFDSTMFGKLRVTGRPFEASDFLDDLGMFIASKDKIIRGEQVLNYAVGFDTITVDARKHLAIVQAMEGNYDNAIENFRIYLKQNESDVVIHDALGDALYQSDRLNEAEKEYLAAVDLDGTYEDAYRGLVHVYKDENDNASMIKILQRYLNYLPPTSETAINITKKIEELKQSIQ